MRCRKGEDLGHHEVDGGGIEKGVAANRGGGSRAPTTLINQQGQCSNPWQKNNRAVLLALSVGDVDFLFPSPQARSEPGPLGFVEMVYHEMTELAMTCLDRMNECQVCQFLSAFGSDFFTTRPSRSAQPSPLPPARGHAGIGHECSGDTDGVSLTFVPGS